MKELMTPATFLPIIILAIAFGTMGNAIGNIEEELTEPPIIGVINEDTGNYSNIAMDIFNNTTNITYYSEDILDKEEAIDKLKLNEGVSLIIINQNFSADIDLGRQGGLEIYWIMRGAGILDSISSGTLVGIIDIVQNEITKIIVQKNDTSKNITTTLNPITRNETTFFKNNEFSNVSPTDISNMISSQSTFIPIIMMMIIIMAGQLVITSMAFEKENKTLETLLTLPVKRTSIVTGKIVASALIGLILAVIYMLGMGAYLTSFEIQTVAGTTTINLSLSTLDFLLIGASLFVALVAALAFCMFLGTMAKNFKSAQTLTFPVVVLVLIPMILTMMKDFDTLPLALKAFLFGIPFSHPMMAPRALLFDDHLIVIGGIIYTSIFAIIMIALVVWVFKTDRIVTGSIKYSWKSIFKKRK
jgi:ABC-2 type transport system permease protein